MISVGDASILDIANPSHASAYAIGTPEPHPISMISTEGARLSIAHARTSAVPTLERIFMKRSVTASQPAEEYVVMSPHPIRTL
jgi:uncharacterized protein (DUF2252 family)